MRRVSILMPCRDAAEHIEAAITSVREQTFTDYEVVAVDDGSTDETYGHLYTWAQQDSRVRVMQTAGRGLVPALATALAAARGELVARMDADDIAEPSRLEKQVALMDENPDVAACGTRVEYFPDDAVGKGARRYQRWINGLISGDEIGRDIFVECPIPHPTLMIRRNVLINVGGYRELGWPEDYDLIFRVWAAGYHMAKVPETLLRWREHPRRVSRTDERYADIEFRRLKIYFLKHTLLAGDRHAVVWGAGPVGKTFARELAAAGTQVAAFVDVDPKKIGQEIHGAPVIAPDDVSGFVQDYDPPGWGMGGPENGENGESTGHGSAQGTTAGAGQGGVPDAAGVGRGDAAAGGGDAAAGPSGGPAVPHASGAEDPRITFGVAKGIGPAPDPPRPLILAAVGQEGARDEIRDECRRQGLVEMRDFVAVA